MQKLYAIALLLSVVVTSPVLAGPNHRRHVDVQVPAKVQVGAASWYGRRHAGRLTANGERFDPQAMTCAHRSLPLGSVVRVTDLTTGKNVALEVNDRGPYVKGRILDLSEGAARKLGIGGKGVTMVRLEVIHPPVQPS